MCVCKYGRACVYMCVGVCKYASVPVRMRVCTCVFV